MIFCLGCTFFFRCKDHSWRVRWKDRDGLLSLQDVRSLLPEARCADGLKKWGYKYIGHLSKCNIWNIHGTFKTQQSVPTSTNSFQRLSDLSDWQNSDINFAMYPSYIHPESLRCQGHRNAKEARRMSDRTARLSRWAFWHADGFPGSSSHFPANHRSSAWALSCHFISSLGSIKAWSFCKVWDWSANGLALVHHASSEVRTVTCCFCTDFVALGDREIYRKKNQIQMSMWRFGLCIWAHSWHIASRGSLLLLSVSLLLLLVLSPSLLLWLE